MRIIFLDTETTGLHVYKGHMPWEIGMLVAEDHTNLDDVTPFLYRVYPDLSEADPAALQVGKFYERTQHMDPPAPEGNGVHYQGERWSDSRMVARDIAPKFEGALIVGNNPGFDIEHIEIFCLRNGQVAAPFHRKINVVDVALGFLLREKMMLESFSSLDAEGVARLDQINEAVKLPHSSRKVLGAAGCPTNEDEHTALGDAKHVQGAFRHLFGL